MTRESSNEQLVYVVEGGETEHGVARLFGVRVDAVRRANPRVGGLRHGDVLVIPPIADAEYVRWCEAMTGVGSVAQNRRRKLVQKSQVKQVQRKTPSQAEQPLSEEECNKKLAAIFGGLEAVVATINEPSFVPPAYRGNRIHHLADNGTIHIYADKRGSSALVGLYAPANYKLLAKGSGEYVEKGSDIVSNVFKLSYPTGLVISFFHVRGTVGGEAGGRTLRPNSKEKNSEGSVRIGYIGGVGGNVTEGYIHTHIQFDVKGKRTDPRKIYCGHK